MTSFGRREGDPYFSALNAPSLRELYFLNIRSAAVPVASYLFFFSLLLLNYSYGAYRVKRVQFDCLLLLLTCIVCCNIDQYGYYDYCTMRHFEI
jgi:hypothetical protein